jgi:hypothetical protein
VANKLQTGMAVWEQLSNSPKVRIACSAMSSDDIVPLF